MPYRTKWMSPDFRRDPRTNRYCVVCQRDLKEGQPHRIVMFELDTYDAVHSEDWEAAQQDILGRRTANDPVCIGLVGMDCAKRIGLEFTKHP